MTFKCPCSGCSFQSEIYSRYFRHLKLVHSPDSQLRIICNYRNCTIIVKGFSSLVQHLSSNHQRTATDSYHKPLQFRRLKCSYKHKGCESLMIKSLNSFVSHLHQAHKPSVFHCIFKKCKKVFSSHTTYRAHLYTHKQSNCLLKSDYQGDTCDPMVYNKVDSDLEVFPTTLEESYHDDVNEDINTILEVKDLELDIDDRHTLKLAMANYQIKLCTMKYLPYSSVIYSQNEHIKLLKLSSEMNCSSIKNIIQQHCQENDCESVGIELIQKITSSFEQNVYIQTLQELNSAYKFQKFVEANFCFTKPEDIIVNKACVGKFVSIVETFKFIISEATFTKKVEKSNDGNIRYLRDADIFKSNTYFQENPEAYILILHSDVVSVVNPLGGAKNSYQMLRLSFSLGEIESWRRSKLKNMFTICNVNYSLCKGFEDVIHGRVEKDLIELENGILIDGKLVKAGLLFFVSDSLEAHYLAGLSRQFSWYYICRFCFKLYASLNIDEPIVWRSMKKFEAAMKVIEKEINEKNELNIQLIDQSSELVDEDEACDNEETYCNDLLNDEDTNENEVESPILIEYEDDDDNSDVEEGDHCDMKMGWVRCPPYMQLKSYHPLVALPPCILHDLLEGVLSYDSLMAVKYLVIYNFISIENLNLELKSFPYSQNETQSRPVLLPKTLQSLKKLKKMPGKGYSIATLVRVLPRIIEKHVICKDPTNYRENPAIKFISVMTELLEICLSDCFDSELLDNLKITTDDYFLLRNSLPVDIKTNLKPKHHYVSHLYDLIPFYGPPLLYSTARWESKHTEATMMQNASKNFRNVPLTVTRADQYRLASLLYEGLNPEDALEICSKEVQIKGSFVDQYKLEKTKIYDEIIYKATKYHRDGVLVLGISSRDKIEVGQIEHFLVDDSSKIRVLVKFATAVRENVFKYFYVNQDVINHKCIFIDDILSFKCLKAHGSYTNYVFSLYNAPVAK